MLRNSIKIAWRNIISHKSNSLINFAGLTIGMAAACFIFIWAQNEYSYNNFFKDADSIHRLKSHIAIDPQNTWIWENSPYNLGEEIKTQIAEVESVSRCFPMDYNAPLLHLENGPIQIENAVSVDKNWFDLFSYDFIEGNAKSFESNMYGVVLTETAAEKYLGKFAATGQIMKLDSLNYIVEGIIKDFPANSSFKFDVYLSLEARYASPEQHKDDRQWGNFSFLTFIKTADNANLQDLPAKITEILTKNRDRNNAIISLVGLNDLHFENDIQSGSSLPTGNARMVSAFLILGFFLLGIACINFVNLTTARASLRAKEVSIRKILGAPKKQIFVQFFIESVLMSAFALTATLLLLRLMLPFFNQLTENNFIISYYNPSLLLILGTTLMISVLLTSIYPALLMSGFQPMSIFRGRQVFQLKDTFLRKSLVVTQFTISIVLIAGTLIVFQQLQFIQNQSQGYDRSQIFTFQVPWELWLDKMDAPGADVRDVLRQKLEAESSVDLFSVMNGGSLVDMNNSSSGNFDWEGRPEDSNPAISPFHVDEKFKDIANLKIIEGRWFNPESQTDKVNVLLNETAAKELGIKEPVIGQRFNSQGDTGIIIGIVEDFHYRSMHTKIAPVIIKNYSDYSSSFLIRAESGRHMDAVAAVEKIWKELVPQIPFQYQFLDDEFNAQHKSDQKTAGLIWIFSTIAIFISCLGLYGLAAFSAQRRTREIGIRKVLGATIRSVVQLISAEFIILVTISIFIATPIAWWLMSKWLEEFAYRIEPGWWMFAAAGLIAILVAFITVSFQAIKAAIANPVKSLRTE